MVRAGRLRSGRAAAEAPQVTNAGHGGVSFVCGPGVHSRTPRRRALRASSSRGHQPGQAHRRPGSRHARDAARRKRRAEPVRAGRRRHLAPWKANALAAQGRRPSTGCTCTVHALHVEVVVLQYTGIYINLCHLPITISRNYTVRRKVTTGCRSALGGRTVPNRGLLLPLGRLEFGHSRRRTTRWRHPPLWGFR